MLIILSDVLNTQIMSESNNLHIKRIHTNTQISSKSKFTTYVISYYL